jgi:DNA-binding NarL/FixJ family response regulator
MEAAVVRARGQANGSSARVPTSTVQTYLIRCGGVRPDPRHRGAGRLSLEEREEIIRALAADQSLRVIAARLGRSTSTVSADAGDLRIQAVDLGR